MSARPMLPGDRDSLVRLIERVEAFGHAEREVAIELVDDALARPETTSYELLVADDEGSDAIAGYVCFGRIAMTERAWDLYWVATDPAARGRGVARGLVAEMERRVAAEGGGTVRVETSSRSPYAPAVGLYRAAGYTEVGRIADFYAPGDDLLTFARRVPGA